jgi:NTE family protein
VRGFAHLGVIKALQEFEIKPSVISGTSAGSLMGAFIAADYPPQEIISIAKSSGIFSFSNILFRKQGFFAMKSFETIFLKYIPHNSFEQLSLPLTVAATDIVKAESVYFNSGELAKPLMASSCVPLVFEPISYNGMLLLDGGILNNLPIEPLQGNCDKLIGIHVNSISSKMENLHMKDIADRSFHLALSSAVRLKAAHCDFFIEPPEMTKFGIFEMDKMQEIVDYAYKHTISLKPEIEKFKQSI